MKHNMLCLVLYFVALVTFCLHVRTEALWCIFLIGLLNYC